MSKTKWLSDEEIEKISKDWLRLTQNKLEALIGEIKERRRND